MVLWRNLLKPISIKLDKDLTNSQVVNKLITNKSAIGFIYEAGEITGYVSLLSLMNAIQSPADFERTVEGKTDILKVPENAAVEFYYHCSVFLGLNEQEEITGYTTADEAERLLNEKRLTEMNESMDHAQIGIITTDENFRITFMNETAETIMGLPRTFLMERNYRTLVQTDRDLSEVLEGKRLLNVKSSFNFKQMSGHFSPIYKKDSIKGMVHVFFLQEQLEEIARELAFVKEMNEDLQAIYSSSNEQILTVDAEGTIVTVAGSFLCHFWDAENSEDIIGANVFQLEKDGRFTPNIADQCIKQQKKVSLVQRTDEGYEIWSTATPIWDEKNKIKKVIVISRDITARDKESRKDEEAVLPADSPFTASHKPKKQLIYRSSSMTELVEEMKHVAGVDSTILLLGESGVGKEVFAQHLHYYSKRKEKPFVSTNCGAIPENLLESELFGYEKGAFTGAQNSKKGMFELADGGTLLLDEITEMPLLMQVKLLRALQEREIIRVGGTAPIEVDVRVIATTNRNIKKLVQEQKFREDLYYRLNVVPMRIPSLRERKDDIVSLSLFFLEQLNDKYGMEKNLSRDAILLLESYRWPGNVRELQNMIERLAVTTKEQAIKHKDVYDALYKTTDLPTQPVVVEGILPLKEAVEQLEDQLIQMAVEKYGKAADAAKALKISPATISRRMSRFTK
ncbi:sigma 54-interacting transcriptional regulator [Fictibacillus sp. NE201]|uniref:HTH-type transcriptional regulatory protein TyrR n=1 Tax=Fictibacillus fluitans TaxID=3058422 RepID=A0ABT8HSZ7_9BACL|nr:sigma 54-interacting transcriptional regulator [Fictibacillus sp. NE201]MDN4523902.1 sigma 54-interacting transcriptional regulator [Fictibacillus sp. NE201]